MVQRYFEVIHPSEFLRAHRNFKPLPLLLRNDSPALRVASDFAVEINHAEFRRDFASGRPDFAAEKIGFPRLQTRLATVNETLLFVRIVDFQDFPSGRPGIVLRDERMKGHLRICVRTLPAFDGKTAVSKLKIAVVNQIFRANRSGNQNGGENRQMFEFHK